MRYIAALLILLAGCSQHKHPQEHPYEARIKAVEMELLKHSVFLDGVTRLDKQLIALEKQIGVNNADISRWFIEHERRMAEHERRMEELSVEIGSMQLSNGKLLTDIYSIANKNKRDLKRAKKQKLIELREENDEDEDDEDDAPWDGKLIGPPLVKPEKD